MKDIICKLAGEQRNRGRGEKVSESGGARGGGGGFSFSPLLPCSLSCRVWLAALLFIAVFPNGTGAGTLKFDGVSSRVQKAGLTGFPTTAITTEFWVRTAGPAGRGLFSYSSATADNEWTLFSPDNLRVHVGSAGAGAIVDTGVAIHDGQWHHVAVSWRNTDSQVQIHMDGVSVFTGVLAGRVGYVFKNGGFFALGQDQDSFGGGFSDTFQGELDEFRIWNRVLTTPEIQQNMNRSLAGNEGGLFLYYPVTETGGTATFDATSNNHHGVSVGGVTRNLAEDATSPVVFTDAATTVTTNSAAFTGWTDPNGATVTNQFAYGPGSTALRFDGVNDYVSVPGGAIPASGNFTVEVWAKLPNAPGSFREILSQGTSGNAFYIGTDTANNLRLGDGWGTTGVPYPIGGWHHFAVVKTSTNSFFYLDGVLVARRGSASPNPTATELRFGRQFGANAEYWPGSVDEVRIWSGVALDAATIRDWMFKEVDNTHAAFASLNGYWQFNEGAGTVATDSSGNGRDGALLNGPVWQEGVRPALTQVTAPTVVVGTNAALDLNGVNGYVDVPDGVWFNGNFTLELKAFLRSYSNWGRFLDFANGPGANEVIFSQDGSGRLTLWMQNVPGSPSSSVTSSNLLPLNQWLDLAVTVQGSTATLYQNGVVVGAGTVTAPVNVLRTLNWIGRPHWPGETYGNEILDDIRIWNVARTADEIRAGTNGVADPTHPNLLLNYRFNGDSGGVARDSRTVFPRDGQLLGGAAIVANSNLLLLPKVSAPVSGLAVGTRHYFRSSAANTNGAAVGLIRNFATLNPGRGTAVDFDGLDDQITGAVPQLPVGNSPYTIEAWIQPRAMGDDGIVGWGNYGVNNQANALRLYANGVHHYWWGNDLSAPVGDLTDGWHHVAVTFDGTVRKVFVDGVVRAAANAAGHNVTTNGNFSIGKTYGTEFFDGQIDEVRIWNIARSDVEVAQYMNERLIGSEAGLVLYQRLDEGGGTITRDATANATELGLLGGPEWAGSRAGVAISLATTAPATGVGFGGAQLNGTVNLEASQTTFFWFEYGVNGNLSEATSVQPLPADLALESVSTTLTNLQGGQVHSFRLVAANGNGTNAGAVQTFYMPYPASATAVQFDGTNHVNLGASPALKATLALSVEAWIYPTGPGQDAPTGGIIVNKEGEYEFARFADGTLRWAMAITSPNWSWVNSTIVAPLNQWMHIAFTYDRSNVRLYTNGVLARTMPGTGNIGDFNASMNELWIGQRQAGGQGFQGRIDEVRVWNVTRSAADIAANYSRFLAGNETGLLLYLRFDEGTGNTVYDNGPNHFLGVLVNSPTFVSSGAAPTSPLVTTLVPTPVFATSATLRGSVNPAGEGEVFTYFEYGPTVAYGSPPTGTGTYPGGLAPLPQSAALTGLEPGTTYHYRLVGFNTTGTTNYGANQTFTTLVLGSGWPVSTKLTVGEASAPLHVLDGLGNTYVAGVFSGTAVFKSEITPQGGATANAFVGKMSRTADWLWAANIPASANGFTAIKAIGTDADRNVYVAGQFSGTNTFGGTELISNNDTNLFVAKLGSFGTNWLWAKSVGGAGPDSANALSMVGNQVFVAGSFSGTANFTVSNLVSAGGSDVFVASLDSEGNWLWANRGGGTSNCFAHTLAMDASTNLYVAGHYSGNATFGELTTLTNAGGTDLFVAKLTPTGAWVQARRGGGVNHDTATALTRDGNQFYLVGQFGGTANFDGTVNNLNVGSTTNTFVLRLNTEAFYLDYTQGGAGTARAVTVDSLGRVYVAGDFPFTTTFGTNSLFSSGNSDVFIAQLVSGDWTWAQKIGSAGTETAGAITAAADNSIVVSGTYQGTIQIGYVALSTPNVRDIFIARFNTNRVYEHNNYIVGQAIPVPVDAQNPDFGDGAIGQPLISILEKDRPDSDELNSFVWSISEQKLYPVRQVTAILKWPLTTNPTNTTAIITAVGRITYPTNPVVHVANAPAELEPAVTGFPLKFVNLAFTTINGASVDASTKIFTAPQPGWSVLQFLVSSNALPDPLLHPSKFEVVRTVNWNDPQHLLDNQPAPIGATLEGPSHSDPAGKNGYVYFENAFYDGAGDERAYDRASRVGPIIPVNLDTASATDDLVVIWYQVSANGIAWPGTPVRYLAHWPGDAVELVLASRLGSGSLDLSEYPSRRVYNQPDRNLPGFNPNEEHAALYGATLYALRNDLNNVINPKASEPYTLLKYRSPETDQWAMTVYKVVTTNATFPLIYSGVAGAELAPPEPLSFLDLCNLSNRFVSGPGFQDYLGRLYARAAGSGASGTNIVARYWYPLQADFFYDFNLDGTPEVPVGTCVPWLDRRPGGSAGTPVDITYNITWPVTVPTLQIGETLLTAKFGLPDLRNFAAANVVYDQGNPLGTNALESLVRLFDPLSSRTLQLDEDFTLPATIVTANDAGKLVFTDLPYSLRARLRYDVLNQQISFSGLLDESVNYGGEQNPLLLINVLSPRERDRIKKLGEGLDGATAFQDAIDDLYDLTRNPNRLDADRNGQVDKTLLIGLAYSYQTNGNTILTNIAPEALGDIPKALTAGPGTGTGYITVVENNDSSLSGLPVTLHVIRVADGPFRGDIKVLKSDNVFDEKLTLRHSADFGGEPQRFEFEWYYKPVEAETDPSIFPDVLEDGSISNPQGWTSFFATPPDPIGLNDITLGDGGTSSLLVLADNYFICRYRGYVINGDTNWSDWVGIIGGTQAQLAEGWVKRVRDGLNPFEARSEAFHENETVTFASMLQQAGSRYEGDIAFNPGGGNINSIGLIEAYETVLRRAKRLSIEATPAINYQPANDALLLAAGFIADLYFLLGNEAVADAADPTIGFRTDNAGYGTLAPSIFTFQNQLDSLLEEELCLLRGRDDRSATVRLPPVYNRLFWNFTRDEGEVAYAQAYNITDQNSDGFINANDARVMYPQAHGDAWGHYLTATKTYYSLLQNPYFDWIPRSEPILLAGVPVLVDYLDERKFARAAAAKAKVGAEVVDLTYRLSYVDDPNGQYQGYKDTDANRAWGLSEWGHRAASAAFFDWVIANAVLPSVDPNPTNIGISKIDRTTVPELGEIIAGYESVQSQVDKANAGLNPLGLAKNVVPFDIDPAQIDSGKTHFEQIYDRALEAVNNTVTVFNHANQLSQSLRSLQDSVSDFAKNADQQERDLKNRLIEVFGYPYAGDIGPGRTYPSGYDGPDLYHYMYVNPVEFTGDPEALVTNTVGGGGSIFTPRPLHLKAFFKPIRDAGIGVVGFLFPADLPVGVVLPATNVLEVQYPVAASDYSFSAPASWGRRRAPGELQSALSDILQAEAALKRAREEHSNHVKDMEAKTELLQANYNLQAEKLLIKQQAKLELKALEKVIEAGRFINSKMTEVEKKSDKITDATVEMMPKSVGTSSDVTAPLRGTAKFLNIAKNLVLAGVKFVAEKVVAAAEDEKEFVEGREKDLIEKAEFSLEVQKELKELEKMLGDEKVKRLEMLEQAQKLDQIAGAYEAALAKGLRLVEERIAFRKDTAAETQASRYQDMTFRIFRNDAIQKYRAQFDLAARYVFLAAVAYDFETQLLEGRSGAGSAFLTDIVRQRALGEVINGVPVAGRHGLADPLARLNQNFGVLKGQLGFNNPQTETGRFSLRNELFRLRASSDEAWRATLQKQVVPNLWDIPEFRRYCRPFAPESAGPQPGLVIRFSTTINFGFNYFGWPLGGGDSAYDSTLFATKVRSAGVWFSDYNGSGLSLTPRLYLVPAGADIMRSPSGNNLETREWRVVDQKIPVPFPIGFSSLNNAGWIPMNDSLSDTFADVRRFSSFRAFHDSGIFDPAETITDSRLIGRSVWNTDWMLIIPGGTFLFDPDEGLDTFISSVSDIKIFFQTYAYSGN
jgi:hypothetical protein